ncbi:MAG: RNA polymerase factor sigma-54 [Bacteroidetes bacterium]|nr:RNA polymerase factor sigma-54 [Bacteroidota bacterium]
MLRQNLSQKQIQKLSPQQIQLMKLLQVPTAILEQRIKEELEANPALEEGREDEEPDPDKEAEEEEEKEDTREEETIDVEDYLNDDDYGYTSSSDGYNKDEDDKTIPVAVPSTFHDHLIKQLGLLDLAEHEVMVAEQLVGSIDDDGYIRRDLEAIIDDLAFTQNVMTDEAELERLLLVVQNFEPAGVGARTLQECLLLQINRKEDDRSIIAARRILQDYFESFTKKHYDKLMRHLDIDEQELKGAIDEILKLNPKPGGSLQHTRSQNQYIIPDFTVKNVNSELDITLNSRNAPDLRVSDSFREMMQAYNRGDKKDKKQKDAVVFIKRKIDSAKWFIDAIKQRQHTLLSTMQAIVDYQKDFFLTGDEARLRPMILKDIAEITFLDISTVSRVANSKYVQTEYGTYKLKYFFSESILTESGEEVSTREVKNILQGIIKEEDKSKPLSDQKLTDMLKERGYNIARRTVAKYREQLNIPVARLRKELL